MTPCYWFTLLLFVNNDDAKGELILSVQSVAHICYCYEWLCFISPIKASFCVAITKYKPLHFKFTSHSTLLVQIRNTHITISFYMVVKHKNLTDKMRRTEIPPTYSVESLMLPTICCSFIPKCYNAWPYMSYGQCQSQKNREYCVQRLNKANSSPAKVASVNFSNPVRWQSIQYFFTIWLDNCSYQNKNYRTTYFDIYFSPRAASSSH